jgi:hypothetical protein
MPLTGMAATQEDQIGISDKEIPTWAYRVVELHLYFDKSAYEALLGCEVDLLEVQNL